MTLETHRMVEGPVTLATNKATRFDKLETKTMRRDSGLDLEVLAFVVGALLIWADGNKDGC